MTILKESNPVGSTNMGIIIYNNLWPDISKHGVDHDIRTLNAIKSKLQEFSPTDENQDDYHLLSWFLEINLHELERLRWWESAHYLSSTILSGIISLTRKKVPDQTSRVRSIIARLRSISPLIKGEQRRIIEPVTIWTEVEINSINGLIDYLEGVPELFKQESEALLDELTKTIEYAQNELKNHLIWLNHLDGGPIRTRPEAYSELLEKRKIGLNVEELEQLGWDYLESTLNEMQDIANNIHNGDVEELRKLIRMDHAKDFDEVIQHYQLLADKARKFLIDKEIVTMPKERLEIIRTPGPMKKFLSIAAAGMPGRFDEDQTGYFYCTVHDDLSMLEEHSFAYQPLLIAHESYPGHHLHGAAKNIHPSMVRTNIFSHPSPNTGLMYSSKLADITEGWGLYTEEMMWKAGYENDPDNPNLRQRFLQVNAARWRAARIVIDTQLHTGRMSFDEAVNFLMDKTGYHKKTATAELMMYSRSPGYFSSYLLGKHQLTELRKKTKNLISDQEYHDQIIYAGNVPYWFIEKKILENLNQ
tara:strand:- start:2951 stop:4543 length:1593 start_codon:yes stop_codon:yes gene_type:complete